MTAAAFCGVVPFSFAAVTAFHAGSPRLLLASKLLALTADWFNP
jgi:hypothetical protein